jgi:hypothetical protein
MARHSVCALLVRFPKKTQKSAKIASVSDWLTGSGYRPDPTSDAEWFAMRKRHDDLWLHLWPLSPLLLVLQRLFRHRGGIRY